MGIQSLGLISTPKYFAVYSIPVGGRDEGTRTDTHVALCEMQTLLLESFGKGFQETGVFGVMSSYNDYDGEPITGSYHFLTELLLQKWGFKGYAVSDSEAIEFLRSKHKTKEVSFVLAPQELGLIDIHNNFVVEPRTFTIMVGSSSENIEQPEYLEVSDI